MKRMLLLVFIMAISFTTSSAQSLSPKILVQGEDTSFVFSIPQSKFIAQRLSSGLYCDSVSQGQDLLISSLFEADALNKGKILIYKEKISNLQAIDQNNQKVIDSLNNDLNVAKAKIKRQKLYTRLSLVGMVLFGVLAIR